MPLLPALAPHSFRNLIVRQEPDFFGEVELSLVYIARKLREALALEEVLTKGNVNYLVEPDRYTGGIIFRAERVGAFFYVAPGDEEAARVLMLSQGYKPWDAD